MKNNHMKHIFLISIFFLSGISATLAQESKKATLIVEMSGMDSDKGAVFVAIYKGEENFLKKRYKGDVVKITDKKAIAVFKDLEKGEYAVSVFHDENDNKKMDTNFFGIPKEAYGSSNGARGFMGPPKYKKAKFNLEENKTIKISIR